jgi:isopenicillin N synthase-like dioxygenase
MASDPMKQIPNISLRELKTNNSETMKRLAEACRYWGFFRLIDLELERGATDQVLAAMKIFFSLPHEEKKQLSRTEKNPWGYFDEELTKNKQDWKEIFDLSLDHAHPNDQSQTPWPSRLPGFRDTMLQWHKLCETISLTLLESIMQSLRLPQGSLAHHFTEDNSSFLRLNHYPICQTPAAPDEDFPTEGHLGIYHHTDAGAVTVLLQDKVSGLQVRHNDTWTTIANENDSLIINVGDLVQVWSNDRYKAPLHRVLANSKQDRFSAAFFMNPAFSTNCIPQTGEAPLYRSVNWGEFRSARAAGDYANIGDEVQISDYRI